MRSLKELLVSELKDLYSAEKQIVRALPQMAKAAFSEELRRGFLDHLDQTKVHVERLEDICEELRVSPKGKKCKGVEGLLLEGKELMEEKSDPVVLDAGLIAAAQRVEHYEMASYGSARAFAVLLGYPNVANMLQQTLDEERATDEKLTTLSDEINVQAEKAA
jgi:ferritin-like metal-binding protein YciE